MLLKGKLIVFEGVDCVGKSTLAQHLANHLSLEGTPCKYVAFPGREPGTLGSHVYLLHHDQNRFGIKSISSTSLQLLHIAAHIDAIENIILPALVSGYYVVLDRFWWSTWVYGLKDGVAYSSLEKMLDLEINHWGQVLPALVFLIHRSKPFCDDISVEQLTELHLLYNELIKREVKRYRIEIINNDESVEKTLANLVSITNSIRSELVSNG